MHSLHNGSRVQLLSFPSHIYNDTILPSIQSNPKIVGGLPCPDPVGGLDPSKLLSLNHTLPSCFRLKLFFMKPSSKSPESSRRQPCFPWNAGDILSHQEVANSCWFCSTWELEGSGWVKGEGDVWPKLFYLLGSSALRLNEHVQTPFFLGSARNTVMTGSRNTIQLEFCF